MTNVTQLPRTAEPNRQLIDLLEKHLQMARKGDLQAVFLVGGMTDGDVSSAWSLPHENPRVITLLGGIENGKMDYQRLEIEKRRK